MNNQPGAVPPSDRISSGRLVSIILAALAAGLLLVSLRLPLWHMRMEAPQYRGPEALNVVVRPGSLGGDLNEIKVLNHYIGVTIPGVLPQTRWLPLTICLGAGLGLAAALLPLRWRRLAAFAVVALLAGAVLIAAAQAQWQMYRIGHDRNPHAALKGVGDFTPPLLGSRKLAQFELTSALGVGSACIAGALALYSALGLMARKRACPRSAEYSRRAGAVRSKAEPAQSAEGHSIQGSQSPA